MFIVVLSGCGAAEAEQMRQEMKRRIMLDAKVL